MKTREWDPIIGVEENKELSGWLLVIGVIIYEIIGAVLVKVTVT